MERLIIKNAVLCDGEIERKADIQICNGKIEKIAERLEGENAFDALGLHLLPALIDLNVAPQEYNQKSLEKLQEKALRGGVGTIFLSPHNDLSYYEFVKLYNQKSKIDFLCGIVPLDKEGKIGEIAKLKDAGGESLVFASSLSNNTLGCLYQYAQMLQIPCMCVALDNELSRAVSTQSELAYKMGISQIPPYFQEVEFAKIDKLASYFKVPTLLRLISEVNVLDDVRDNAFLQSEVSIHHLILDEKCIEGYNTWAKLSPPLGISQTKEQLQKKLSQIDMLTSLHQEFPKHQKEQTFEDAVCGVDCLEFYFSLLYTTLVKSGLLSLKELVCKTSLAQAEFLHLNQGRIEEGYNASLVLVDLNEHFSPNHPLYTQELYGKVKAIITPQNSLIKV